MFTCGIVAGGNRYRWRLQCGAQVPDFLNARIAGEPAMDVIGDDTWFREDFTPTVANRGEQVPLERSFRAQ